MSTEQIKDKFPDAGDFFQTIFESSPYPMWVYDLDTMMFLAVDNAAVEHYGYTREEFLSMNIKEIRPPEEVPRLFNMISRLGMGVQHIPGLWEAPAGRTVLSWMWRSRPMVFSSKDGRRAL